MFKNIAAGAAVVGLGALVVGGKMYTHSPTPYEKKNPLMVDAVKNWKFNEYDRQIIGTYAPLRKAAPTLLQHWSALEKVAGPDYNILSVAETLSRMSAAPYFDFDTAIQMQKNHGGPQAERVIDILERTRALKGDGAGMIADLQKLNSSALKDARETFYKAKGGWQYGNLRSLDKWHPQVKERGPGKHSLMQRPGQGNRGEAKLGYRTGKGIPIRRGRA